MRASQGARRSAARRPVLDGVPCRPYLAGAHAAAVSRILLLRLVAAAVVTAALSAGVTIGLAVATAGMEPRPAAATLVATAIGSPIAFGLLLLAFDWVLVRGRLATAISLLTWAGRRDLADMRASTGLQRATDREGARRWLAERRAAGGQNVAELGWRAHLEILVGNFADADETIKRLPAEAPEERLRVAALRAQLALARGLPFDADDLREQTAALPDSEVRATMAAEVAALIAQARWTCGGDHLGAIAWAVPFVAGRDRGTLTRGYWLPIAALLLISSVVMALLFPVST